MPLSTLSNQSSHNSQQSQSNNNSASNSQQLVVNNQNLLHVKFHVNKFQDNLLSKRLQQLNVEEMKLRLKHQRTSNELVVFLKECQQSTGYLSKMKQIDNSGINHKNNDASFMRENNNNNTNGLLSNAVKNMINASILVVDSDLKETFESKSCQDYTTLRKNHKFDHMRRASTAALTAKHNIKTSKGGSGNSRKNSMKQRRARSQSLFAINNSNTNNTNSDTATNEFLKSDQQDSMLSMTSEIVQNSSSQTLTDGVTEIEIEKLNDTPNTVTNRRNNSKSATTRQTLYHHESSVKIPLFEHILLNSNASPINSATSCSVNSSSGLMLSKAASSSSRSDTSTFSNSSESFSESNNKEHLLDQQLCSLQTVPSQRIRPITSNVVRSKRRPPVLSSHPTLSSSSALTTFHKLVAPPPPGATSSINFSNSSTISNLDWFTSTTLNFVENQNQQINTKLNTNNNTLNEDDNTISPSPSQQQEQEQKISSQTNLSDSEATQTNISTNISKKILKKSRDTNHQHNTDFKSRSLNFILSSNNGFNSRTIDNTTRKNSYCSSTSGSSSSSYCTSSSLSSLNTRQNDINNNTNNLNKSMTGPKPANSTFGAKKKNSICSSTTSALTNYLAATPGQHNSLQHLPMRQQQKFPIQVNMSRSSMKKKQLEIINEYNRYNTLELLSNLRKIQHNLDIKVKQFTNKTIMDSF